MAALHEACGVFGIFAPGVDVARVTFFGIFALQHRGQESAGIATSDGSNVYLSRSMGLVTQAFNEKDLASLVGHIAIGHTRYSTTGSSQESNAQPILIEANGEKLALAHNGNIVNSMALREDLVSRHCVFQTSTDSEVIANLIVTAPDKDLLGKIRYAMKRLQGAYSLVILTKDNLVAVRDPMGVRPLCLGTYDGGWIVASETCALDHIGGTLIKEVAPGEIIMIDRDGFKTYEEPGNRRALCIFEYIYFARPDSRIQGKLLYPIRQSMGRVLAREYPVDADIVIGVPDSATAAGIGYSQESGITYCEGLLKNRYVGRTFIAPDQRIRDLGVRLKFNPLAEVISGKRVVLVDDSIVRGTTTPHVVAMVRKAGATEVHLRICAPPIRHPCFFGVDMATRHELIAYQKSVEEIRRYVNADSLGFISVNGLVEAVGLPKDMFCLACFTGDYPIPVQLEMDKMALENTACEGINGK
jgi:amidophosphoribosyltransferase